MRILLVYPPFCAPTVPPYSISRLKFFLGRSSVAEAQCLDLNAKFHRLRFPEDYEAAHSAAGMEEYIRAISDFDTRSRKVYQENNRRVLHGEEPDLAGQMLGLITACRPDLVAFSLVYNSQVFYAKALIGMLGRMGIPCIIGGPADSSRLEGQAIMLKDECELLDHLAGDGQHKSDQAAHIPQGSCDFSDYDRGDYLSREFMIPMRTGTSCTYGRCAFCTHSKGYSYSEFPMEDVAASIKASGARHVFFIDDTISRARLAEVAPRMKSLGIRWWCQLRPEKAIIESLPMLAASGLRCISWGVESGSDRVLSLMRKGTRKEDVASVLKASRQAGILNNVFIMFGFPGETKDEFRETIAFLERNRGNIDLVSTSIFGLQRGSRVYADPRGYGVTDITEEKRTILSGKIKYRVSAGMQQEDAEEMRRNYARTLNGLNRLPKVFNYFKEQTLLL